MRTICLSYELKVIIRTSEYVTAHRERDRYAKGSRTIRKNIKERRDMSERQTNDTYNDILNKEFGLESARIKIRGRVAISLTETGENVSSCPMFPRSSTWKLPYAANSLPYLWTLRWRLYLQISASHINVLCVYYTTRKFSRTLSDDSPRL